MVVLVKIYPWQEAEHFNSGDLAVKIGEQVITETDYGPELGEIVEIVNNEDDLAKIKQKTDLKSIIRKAANAEIESAKNYESKKNEALEVARQKIKMRGLKMKLVGTLFSFDGSRVVFSFVSDKRVDFRELAKDLSYHFHKSVKLRQIGSRDEARGYGDYGPCGRDLCCRIFRGDLKSVSTSAAHLQQIDHRGSVRLSGLCGRLRCCLAFEADYYEGVAKKMPPIGKLVNTSQGPGVVKNYFLLKEEVVVELENKTSIRIPISKFNGSNLAHDKLRAC